MKFDEEFKKTINSDHLAAHDRASISLESIQDNIAPQYHRMMSGMIQTFCEPLLRQIAVSNDLIIENSKRSFPDYTLKSRDFSEAIGIEIKTILLRGEAADKSQAKFRFIISPYQSLLAKPSGRFPGLRQQWILGFVFIENPKPIRQPQDFEFRYFVQELHRVAGQGATGGCRQYISSIYGSFADFQNGNGPFQTQEAFEEYLISVHGQR